MDTPPPLPPPTDPTAAAPPPPPPPAGRPDAAMERALARLADLIDKQGLEAFDTVLSLVGIGDDMGRAADALTKAADKLAGKESAPAPPADTPKPAGADATSGPVSPPPPAPAGGAPTTRHNPDLDDLMGMGQPSPVPSKAPAADAPIRRDNPDLDAAFGVSPPAPPPEKKKQSGPQVDFDLFDELLSRKGGAVEPVPPGTKPVKSVPAGGGGAAAGGAEAGAARGAVAGAEGGAAAGAARGAAGGPWGMVIGAALGIALEGAMKDKGGEGGEGGEQSAAGGGQKPPGTAPPAGAPGQPPGGAGGPPAMPGADAAPGSPEPGKPTAPPATDWFTGKGKKGAKWGDVAGDVAPNTRKSAAAGQDVANAKSLPDAVDKLVKFRDAVAQASDRLMEQNRAYAEFSAAMGQVTAEAEAANIRRKITEGEERAGSARFLSESEQYRKGNEKELKLAADRIENILSGVLNYVVGAVEGPFNEVAEIIMKAAEKWLNYERKKEAQTADEWAQNQEIEGRKALLEAQARMDALRQ